MRKLSAILTGVILLLSVAAIGSAATINVGTIQLLENLANQTAQISVQGDEQIEGMILDVFVAGGGAALGGSAGPIITDVQTAVGTIFESVYDPGFCSGCPGFAADIPVEGSGQVAIADILTREENNNALTVAANGVLATITFDTTGFFAGSGPFSLDLSNAALSATTELLEGGGNPIPLDITDGQIVLIPEPSTMLLMLPVGAWLLRRRARTSA